MLGPTWDMPRDKMRAIQNGLMAKARAFAATLPPGSRVAISTPVHGPADSGEVRIEWTLRPVFAGEPTPPAPWITYEFDSPSPGWAFNSLGALCWECGTANADHPPMPRGICEVRRAAPRA